MLAGDDCPGTVTKHFARIFLARFEQSDNPVGEAAFFPEAYLNFYKVSLQCTLCMGKDGLNGG